jgi:hypothetical protein
MITKLFISTILALFISGSWISNGKNSISAPPVAQEKISKAIVYDGEVIPLVELPVIEISGKLPKESFTTAVLIDDHVVPMIYLPEVIILPDTSI